MPQFVTNNPGNPIDQLRLPEIYSVPFRIDEVSSTLFYVGWLDEPSLNQSETSPIWRIRRIMQSGTVWKMQYADGDSNFIKVWSDRAILNYK